MVEVLYGHIQALRLHILQLVRKYHRRARLLAPQVRYRCSALAVRSIVSVGDMC